MQIKVEELEELTQSLRNHYKMKDDAIAHLSDQLLVVLTLLPISSFIFNKGFFIIIWKDNSNENIQEEDEREQ
jgi:hypothetical protein